MVINDILALLNTGRFNDALHLINSLPSGSFEHKFGMLEYYRMHVMTDKYYEMFEQVLEEIDRFEPFQKFLLQTSVFAVDLVTKANDVDRRNEQLDILQQSLDRLNISPKDKLIYRVALTNMRGVVSLYAGLYLNALNLHKEAEDMSQGIPESENIRNVLVTIARRYTTVVYTHLGKFNEGLTMVKELIKLYKEQGNYLDHARSHVLLGNILGNLGRIQEGIENIEKGLSLIFEYNLPKNDEAKCKLQLARLFYAKGNYNQSITYIQEAQAIFEENRDVKYLADCYGMIGKIYFERGSLNRALDAFQKNLAMQIKLGHQLNVSLATKDIAMINYAKKREDNYPVFIEKALERSKEVGNPSLVSELLYYFITFQPGISNKQEQFLQELKELSEKNQSLPLVRNRYLLSKAYTLAQSSRIIDKYSAQQLYFECLERPEMTSDMLFTTYLSLFELLVLELKISHEDNEEVMEDIERVKSKINEFLQATGSVIVKLKLMILQSKFLLLEQKFDDAQDLLKEAKDIAEKQELFHLRDQIIEEKKSINQYVSKWLEIIRQNKDNIEKIQKQRIIEYLQEASKIVELF